MEVKKRYVNKTQGSKRYKIESNCLEKLQSNFECICLNTYHFPKIIQKKKTCLFLSNCGVSLDNDFEFEVPTNFSFYEKQIDCIIHNLKKNKIIHLDMSTSGKNLCISAKGIISMIDFDIVKYKNHDLSKILKNTGIHRSMLKSNDEIRYRKLKKKLCIIVKRKILNQTNK